MQARNLYVPYRALSTLCTLCYLLLTPGGCNSLEPGSVDTDLPQRTGVAITLAVDEQSDVVGMRFRIDRESCEGEPFEPLSLTVERELEDIRLPGGIPDFQDLPLDSGSSHAFADAFIDVPPGCYEIATQPLSDGGATSRDCAPAQAAGVRVAEGRTTEILLINQCSGEGRGAIDVIAALNHPPVLTSVAFERSKFVLQCEEQVVCASARDPDQDPLEFTWQQASGPALFRQPQVVSTTTGADGSVTQCIKVVAESPARYELTVTVYDLLRNPASGGLIRFEEYFTRSGVAQLSRTALRFPFYAAEDGRAGGCTLASCKAVLEANPGVQSGVYTIDPDGAGPGSAFPVFCDMSTAGGGWTVVEKSPLGNSIGRALFRDAPVDEGLPGRERHRLSRSRMQALQAISTDMRIDCRGGDYLVTAAQNLFRGEGGPNSCSNFAAILYKEASLKGRRILDKRLCTWFMPESEGCGGAWYVDEWAQSYCGLPGSPWGSPNTTNASDLFSMEPWTPDRTGHDCHVTGAVRYVLLR